MQRLHQDDLAGNVLESGEDWEVLSLPAIAQEDEEYRIETPFGFSGFRRKAGEVLHPERDSLETLQQIRQTVGEYNFQSQFQQTPMPLEGGMIKREWLRYYEQEELPKRFTFKLQSRDTANKSGELNDYSVCTTWGLYEHRFHLLSVFRKRLSYPDLKRAFADQWKRFQPNKVLIEEKSSGISLIQELKGDGVFGIEAYEPPPRSDKLMRFNAQSTKFESGSVLLPRQAPWLDEYVREITGFPGCKYNDQVDSTAQALDYLGGKAYSAYVWSRFAGH
jgi:predicted phage terminase large subunit-like protein